MRLRSGADIPVGVLSGATTPKAHRRREVRVAVKPNRPSLISSMPQDVVGHITRYVPTIRHRVMLVTSSKYAVFFLHALDFNRLILSPIYLAAKQSTDVDSFHARLCARTGDEPIRFATKRMNPRELLKSEMLFNFFTGSIRTVVVPLLSSLLHFVGEYRSYTPSRWRDLRRSMESIRTRLTTFRFVDTYDFFKCPICRRVMSATFIGVDMRLRGREHGVPIHACAYCLGVMMCRNKDAESPSQTLGP